jgi:hypothetical protein
MYDLRLEILSFPSAVALVHAAFAVCAVNAPKNKRFMGRRQFAIIRSSNATQWLAWISEGLPAAMRIWPFTPTLFRSIFKEAASKLGFMHWNLQVSGLRSGGATHFHVEGTEVSRLKFWGRWASERSLAHYLQEAISALLVLNCPVNVSSNIAAALKDGSCFLNVPDSPWWEHFVRPHMQYIRTIRQKRSSSRALPTDWRALYPALSPAGHEP